MGQYNASLMKKRANKMKKQKNRITVVAMVLTMGLTGYTMPAYGQSSDSGGLGELPLIADASYEKLEEAFENAGTVFASEITAWMSGRCFYSEFTAGNGLLIATGRRYRFSPTLVTGYKFSIWTNPGKGPTYFDHISPRRIRKIRRHTDRAFSSSLNLSVQSDGSLKQIYHSDNQYGGKHYSPADSEYLFRKGAIAGSEKPYLIVKIANERGVFKYCYMFKLVQGKFLVNERGSKK